MKDIKYKKKLIIFFAGIIMIVSITGIIFSQSNADKEMKYSGINYRDPFLSFIPQEKREIKIEGVKPPSLKLQGIVWGGPYPKAIIDNTVVGQGDIIEGVKILEIKKDGVAFLFGGNQFLLERSGIIKTQE